jgi:hypothetical protein
MGDQDMKHLERPDDDRLPAGAPGTHRRRRRGGRATAALALPGALALAAALALAGCAEGPDAGGSSTPAGGTSTEGSTMASNPIESSRAPSVSPPMVSSRPPQGTTAPPSSESPAAPADADLAISLSPDGKTVQRTYRLVCSNGVPVQDTDHPQPADACAFLSDHGAQVLTAPRKPQGMCTQQDNGPLTAVVEGTLNGQQVQRSFSLHNGCQISAWKSAEALLGRGTSTGAL